MDKRCPTCKQTIPERTNIRTCYKCNFPIGLHDKYRYVNRLGITTLEHRHCDNTQSYLPQPTHSKTAFIGKETP